MGTRSTGQDDLVFRPRSWTLVAAAHGNEVLLGFGCEISSKELPGGKQDEKRDL